MSQRSQLSSSGRCTSPSTKEEQADLRLKERLPVQRRALGSQGEGQRGVELRERWEESEQEDRGGARTRAGQTHRI